MNDKEAIKRLKEVIEDCTSGEDEPYKEAFGMAILALEKQTPKKVKQYNDKSIFIYEGVFYCPSCQENVSIDDVYCCQCGQSLDWEVENE